MQGMHKMWMLFDPRRALVLAAIGVVFIAAVIHFVVLSSPRYCDYHGWCAPSQNFVPGRTPAATPPAR
jgi:light-harvesting complex 1 alpha chain